MTKYLAVVFVLFAVNVSAQTHPCDVIPVQNPNLTSPVKVGFCHTGKESDGTTPIAAYQVLLDSLPAPVFSGALTPIGSANLAGLFYYETPTFVVTKGSHEAFVTGVNSTGVEVIARSANVPFGVINPLGVAPTLGRVKK